MCHFWVSGKPPNFCLLSLSHYSGSSNCPERNLGGISSQNLWCFSDITIVALNAFHTLFILRETRFNASINFFGGSDSKESTYNVGDLGLNPGSRRYPGEGNGNPLQYSYLKNSKDRETWWATVHRFEKSWTWLRLTLLLLPPLRNLFISSEVRELSVISQYPLLVSNTAFPLYDEWWLKSPWERDSISFSFVFLVLALCLGNNKHC